MLKRNKAFLVKMADLKDINIELLHSRTWKKRGGVNTLSVCELKDKSKTSP